MAGSTPLWSVTATDCTAVFPNGRPTTSQSPAAAAARRSYQLLEAPGNYTVVMRWEGAAGLDVEVRMTLASPEPPAGLPGAASFTGSVVSAAGVCVQSFSLLDLRGLSW